MKEEGQNKRILIVCQHFWPENFRINDIADFLANEKSLEVDVLCGLPNYPHGRLFDGYTFFGKRHEIHNSINIDRVTEIPRGNNSSLRIFLNYISFPFFSLFQIPRLMTRKYDYILIYQLSPVLMSLPGIILGKIKKIPTTMYVLDLWPENLYSVLNVKNNLMRGIAFRASNYYYNNTSKIIALSETMKNRLIKTTNKSERDIIVLPQAAEKIYEKPIHNKSLHKRFVDKFIILYTGNISPAQSFDTLINAASILKNQGKKNIHWLIVGDGMSRKEAETSVVKMGLEDVFTFEGSVSIDKIPEYTELADVLVGSLVKSDLLEATIPAKVMSYIAAAKPIVLAMDGEVQTLINSTIQAGFAGPSEDSESLASNILKVKNLTTKEKLEMQSRTGQYHKKHLDRDILLNKLYTFIINNP